MQQAAVLAAVLADLEGGALEEAAVAAPGEVLAAAKTKFLALRELLAAHPAAVDTIRTVLHGG